MEDARKVIFSVPTFEAIGMAMDEKWDPEFRLWLKVERMDTYRSRRRTLEMMNKVKFIHELTLSNLKYRMVIESPFSFGCFLTRLRNTEGRRGRQGTSEREVTYSREPTQKKLLIKESIGFSQVCDRASESDIGLWLKC
jgi:hypothetical protein